MNIRKVDSKSVILHEGSKVTLKTCGDNQEVLFTAGNNTKCPIQNLSKDKYLDKETGEIKERVHQESRNLSPKSARKSIHKLMDLIRCNATEASHCKWVTLTYSDIMTNHKQVYEDGKMFLRRLQRHLDKQADLSDAKKSFQRITVAEPQGEGHGNSWHLHVLLIFEDTAPYLENDVISDLWGYGITKTQKVYDADGLALYFKACLSDIDYSDDTDSSNRKIVEKMVDGVSKKFIKGERLKYYPTGMRLYSASRGMTRPTVEKMSNGEAMERVKDCKMVYQETFAIGEGKGGNLVNKRYYKKKIADHLKKPD